MSSLLPLGTRAFKTPWFAKVARKAGIADAELCGAIREATVGQIVDLGGGVFKKRLNDNMHRSIILAKSRKMWVYEYLFGKKYRGNIDEDELEGFRLLSKRYALLNAEQLDALIARRHFLEICHDH